MVQAHFVSPRPAGYTMVELMVALLIGMIIVAAAVQLFTGGVLTARLQQANSEIQDSGLFGVEYLVRDVRLANYGNVNQPALTDVTPGGGIVLTILSAASSTTNLLSKASATPTYISDGLATHGDGDTVGTGNEWLGSTNVKLSGGTAVNSDQLTIQFIAPVAMRNCEGANVQARDLVVQRYFLRQDTNGSTTDFVLACDANTPTPAGTAPSINPPVMTGLGDAGQIIMPRVDHFHILLGTTTAMTAGNWTYYTVKQYRDLTASPKPRIVSLRLAVLVRSPAKSNDPMLNAAQTYQMLDQTVVPKDTTIKYVRQVYTTNVALRNALGEPL